MAEPQDRGDPWTQNAEVSPPREPDDRRAWELVSKLASSALLEQRRARRWGIFFKSLTFLYLFLLLGMFMYSNWSPSLISEPHVGVVRVEGMITDDNEASASNIIGGLRSALENDAVAGVILRINSPGGSAVQAGLVYDEIRRLRDKYPNKPIHAVIIDVCASGGYYIAAAADKIYADKASLVGSIGVRADSFGFVEALDRLGVERRLYTAGENKALLDPFLPERPEQVAFIESVLEEVHRQFIAAVKLSRGDRLQDDPALFSGLFWTGEKSVELGLIDGLGGLREVAETEIGVEKLIDYTPPQGLLERISGSIGVALSKVLAQTLNIGPLLADRTLKAW